MNSYADIIKNYNLILEKKPAKAKQNPENTTLNLLVKISNTKGYDTYEFGKKPGLSNLISSINAKAEANDYFAEALIGGNPSSSDNDSTDNSTSTSNTTGASASSTSTGKKKTSANGEDDDMGIVGNEDEDDDMGILGNEDEDDDSMLKESSFMKTYKFILQQIPASQPTSGQTNQKDNGKKSDDKKDNGKKSDNKDLFADAAKQMDADEGTVTLKVDSKNYFMFYETESDERIESEQTIKKIDTYLRLHAKEILADQIKANKQKVQEGKEKAYTEGIEEGYAELQKLSLTTKKINKDGLISIINGFGTEIFEKITKNIKFGDGTLDKGQYQKVYACFTAIIIGILAVIYKKQGKTVTSSSDDTDDSTDNSSGSDDPQITALNDKILSMPLDELKLLMKKKMTLSGKNPHDKKYLKSLFKYENTHWLPKNRKKYRQALNQLIAEA